MNHSLRHAFFLLFYAFVMFVFLTALIIKHITYNIAEFNTLFTIQLVYIVVSVFLLISACIVIILYSHIMSSHYFFFIAALLNAVPLVTLRAFLPFFQNEKIYSQDVLQLFIKVSSALYVLMSLCLFFSVLFLNQKHTLNIALFFIAGISSLLISTLGTISYTNNMFYMYVGGNNLITYVSIAFYTIILLLYFFEFIHPRTQKRITIPYFLTLVGIIISLLLLCITVKPLIITGSGAAISICLLFYLRNQFIRRL